MRKYIVTFTLISTALLITACGGDDHQKNVDNGTPIKVTISTVDSFDNQPFLTASGKIQASKSADLSTRMMGFVEEVHVNIGDKVKRGQLLVSINSNELNAKRAQVNANIAEATAALSNAQKDYNRYKNLFNSQSASQKEFDDISTNFEMAKARLEATQQMKSEINAQFAYSKITAPFNGIITNKSIEKGDMANPGSPLVSLESPDGFEVEAMIPESEISKIKEGIEVDVMISSINEVLKGKVSEVSSSSKNSGGQYLVKIILKETNANVLSGMFARIQFPVEKQANMDMVLIPIEAIVKNGQLSGVYTVSESNTALLRWLRLGRTYGDHIEVLSGLSSVESYIISSEGNLYNGAKITIQ